MNDRPIWKDAEEAWEKGLEYYEDGDIEAAAKAYEYAASLNHSSAQLNLGNILDDELEPRDPDKAVFWYERAVENGESSGAWNLHLHYTRTGNLELRDRWLRVAREMGHPDACGTMA